MTAVAEEDAAPAARSLGFTVTLGAVAAISATAIDICVPAQPEIAKAFAVAPAAGGALVSSYFWGYALGQLVWGPLSDRFGRILPLQIGIAGFLIASILCACADNMGLLVLARLAEGFFGGCAPITVRAIARDQGGGMRTGRLLATTTMIIGIAPLLAPPLASGMLVFFDWRALFWFLTGFSALVLISVPLFIKTPPHVRVDHGGVSYLARALPILKQFDFLAGAGMFALLAMGYFAVLSVGAAAARERYGVGPQAFGPLFSIVAVGYLAGSMVARRTVGRFHRDSILFACCLVAATSGIILAATIKVGLPQWLFWLLLTAYDFAFGLGSPVAQAKALEPAGKAAGGAASLLGLLSLSAGAFASQVSASSLFASPYHAVCQQMAAAGAACVLLQLMALWRRRVLALKPTVLEIEPGPLADDRP